MEFAEQVASVLAVFGLLALAVYAFGRKTGRPWLGFRNQARKTDSMFVAERLVLTPQHSLHLVRIGDRSLLIATHPQGVAFDPAGGSFLAEFRNAVVTSREDGK